MTVNGATAQQRLLIQVCLDKGATFLWSGPGTFLIKRSDVATVLAEVVANGEVVLGFEGFELNGSYIHPRLDLILDLESGSVRLEDLLSAISKWPDDVWVDVTLDL